MFIHVESQTNLIDSTKNCSLGQSWVLSNCDLRPVMAHNIPWCITSAQQSSKSTRAVCWPQLVWLMVNVDYVRLCQEIKDDGLLPETCHDHNNHTVLLPFLWLEVSGPWHGSAKTRNNIRYIIRWIETHSLKHKKYCLTLEVKVTLLNH